MMYGHGEPSRYHHRDASPQTPHRHARPPPPNWSKTAVNLLLRLCTMILAFASATVMALASSSECVLPSSGATFTYSRFRAFKVLVGFNITAGILEVPALLLHLRSLLLGGGEDDEETAESEMEEEEKKEGGIGVAGIMLVVVDVIVLLLLNWAMVAAFSAADDNSDQIGGCAKFSGQVLLAKLLSCAACAAVILVIIVKDVPLPF